MTTITIEQIIQHSSTATQYASSIQVKDEALQNQPQTQADSAQKFTVTLLGPYELAPEWKDSGDEEVF